jgi:hypothetical protein
MTTGDKVWADRDSRAELQLGSSKIDLAPNTGFSFLNLDDRTVQIQLSSGTINVRVYELDRDNVYEIDTPNQAFTINRPGRYRVESSENGDYSVVTIREGEGESSGNGQSYTIHSGQQVRFSGTNSLNAEVQQIGDPDPFDRWSYDRERRYEDSPSARYCSRQVVGFEDLDEYGDWRPAREYGTVWYPRVEVGWAPYHNGHWAWIDPWGWTWVDDASWGYAPFHYGRWVFVGSRWGWVPGPREVRPVYAPALVAFVGGVGIGVGGNVAWFPLGPREVYVPSYRVSRGYVNRVNVSNTTVNTTTVTNVYNTTIVNNNTTINNVTYVNRNVRGGVTAVPQQAFASAQPVSRTAVVVNESQMRRSPVSSRAAVPPGRESVMGMHANTANRVAAPPQAVASRQVIARSAPPPPPPSFAARQQVLTQHPGVPVSRPQLQQIRATNSPASAPRVITAPPARPTPLPAAGTRPENQPNNRPAAPGNPPAANERPGMNNPANRPQPGNPPIPNNRPQPNQPDNRPQPGANRPFEPPARTDRPEPTQPNNRHDLNQPNNRTQPNQPNNRPEPNQPNPGFRPQPNQPAPNNRPENNRPENNRPENNRPENNRGFEPPARNDRSPSMQPNRPEPSQPAPNTRPDMNRPSEPPARNDHPSSMPPNNRPEPRPDMNRPSEPPARNDHPSSVPPNNRPQPQPEMNRPQPNPPQQNRPDVNRPPQQRNEPAPPPRSEPASRPQAPPPSERQQARPPAENRPAPPPAQSNKSQKPDDKHKSR